MCLRFKHRWFSTHLYWAKPSAFPETGRAPSIPLRGTIPSGVGKRRRQVLRHRLMAVALEAFLPSAGSPVRLLEASPSPSPLVARLAAAAPWLEAVHTPEPEGVPRLRVIGTAPHGEIRFIGPVEGRIAEALAVLCRALATSDVEFDTPATPQLLRELDSGVNLGVYVSPTCAFCPAVLAAVLRFAQAMPHISATVFRADLVPLPGQRSVPAVVANDEVISVGSIGEYDLAERLVDSSREG